MIRRTGGGPATTAAVRNALLLRLGSVQIRNRAVAGWRARGNAWGEASLLAGAAMRAFTEAAEESSLRRSSAQGEHYDRLTG